MDDAQARKLQEQLAQLPSKHADFINYRFMQDTQQAIADAICQSMPTLPRSEFNYSLDDNDTYMPTYLSYIIALAVEGTVLWDRLVVEADEDDEYINKAKFVQLLSEATVKLAWHPFESKVEGVLTQLMSGYTAAAQVRNVQPWFYLVEMTRLFIRHAANDLAHGKAPGESIKDGMFEKFEEVFAREDIPFLGVLRKAVGMAIVQMNVVRSEAEKRGMVLQVELNENMDDSQLMSLAGRYTAVFSLWRKPILLNIHPSGNASMGFYNGFDAAWKNGDYAIETAWIDGENTLRVPFNITHDKTIDGDWMMVLAEAVGEAKKAGLLEQPEFKINARAFAMF